MPGYSQNDSNQQWWPDYAAAGYRWQNHPNGRQSFRCRVKRDPEQSGVQNMQPTQFSTIWPGDSSGHNWNPDRPAREARVADLLSEPERKRDPERRRACCWQFVAGVYFSVVVLAATYLSGAVLGLWVAAVFLFSYWGALEPDLTQK